MGGAVALMNLWIMSHSGVPLKKYEDPSEYFPLLKNRDYADFFKFCRVFVAELEWNHPERWSIVLISGQLHCGNMETNLFEKTRNTCHISTSHIY